ncbi:hypothetical protein HMPREF9151_02396 [Hoylesella saccharolytica F0055]|uniref:Uncharacterized protein n=1 Tax=Hoylesella saccharolytica F0055 TaxID=1127699 RepID=L1N054_9BACT|nr:hypothetical protein HMPREF9151_02396 [Hoylesella saccharolytica F0055]
MVYRAEAVESAMIIRRGCLKGWSLLFFYHGMRKLSHFIQDRYNQNETMILFELDS